MSLTPRLRQNNLLEAESFSPFYLDVDVRTESVRKARVTTGLACRQCFAMLANHSSLYMWEVTEAVGQRPVCDRAESRLEA